MPLLPTLPTRKSRPLEVEELCRECELVFVFLLLLCFRLAAEASAAGFAVCGEVKRVSRPVLASSFEMLDAWLVGVGESASEAEVAMRL